MSSEISDEEFAELWARTVDLPGFDDNVSPNNTITSLFRCVVGEVCTYYCSSCNKTVSSKRIKRYKQIVYFQISINFHRSNDRTEKSYLNLTLKRFCCDLALMEYGPAVQTSIGSIILSDLQHACKNGESVQLFSVTSDCGLVQESINLLYRKVQNLRTHANGLIWLLIYLRVKLVM